MTVLQFGKYKGHDIRRVPDNYLVWLIQNSTENIKLCQAELDRRTFSEDALLSMRERIIKAGFRELAKKHHPDMGGTETEMKELNAAYESLKK